LRKLIGVRQRSQQLAFVAEAAHQPLAPQVWRHHFEGDGLIELPIVAPRQVDRAHAAAAQQPLRTIGAEAPAGARKLIRPGQRRLRAQLAVPAVRGHQRPHFFPNRRIESGLPREPGFALGFRLFERGMKQLLHALPE
jgi:hypothetical protein